MNSLQTRFIQRLIAPVLEDTLKQFPVVVLSGARQTGKSTLVQNLPSAAHRTYITLDDFDNLARAKQNPDTLLDVAQNITLDEVQRAPEILRAIKRNVDRNRQKGRFLLTGSANLLLMRRVSESLAGRAIYLTLLPMSEREKRRLPDPGLWPMLISARSPSDFRGSGIETNLPAQPWIESSIVGGFPPVVLGESSQERVRWFDGYVRTYLERDLQDVASISALVDFRRLMGLTVQRLGQIVNQSELARDAGLSQATAHRYLNLLEASYQTIRVPAFAVNRSKRLIKSPKIYWSDTGLASFLMGLTTVQDVSTHPRSGALLENLVLTQLLAWRETVFPHPQIFYWRTASGTEVDFVVESKHTLLPIEIKTSSRPRVEDIRSLETFLDEYKSAKIGVLIYGGEEILPMTPRIIALPAKVVL